MNRRSHLDDTSFEQLLAGRTVPGQELLVSFVEDVHVATSAEASQPSSELATLFAEGLSTEKGDLLVTAASNVTGPAPQAAGLPKWRKKNMIEIALSKLAALGLAAKIGAATGVVALGAPRQRSPESFPSTSPAASPPSTGSTPSIGRRRATSSRPPRWSKRSSRSL